MKVTLFFVLISLLIANVIAYGDDDYNYDSKTWPKTCEELYKVDKCSECQQTVWDNWKDPQECGYNIKLFTKVIKYYIEAAKKGNLKTYELGPFKDAVKDSCAEEFKCKYEDAEKAWKNIEEKCSKELHTEVDWSDNPLNIDQTVASAYGTLLFYYFGIPDRKSTCLKDSSGEFCSVKLIEKFVEYIKEVVPDGKFAISYDHKYVYKLSDGSRYEIPKHLYTCSECAKKIIEEYKGWHEEHPLPEYIVKNLWGSWEKLHDYYSCPNDSYKMKLRRTFNGPSRRQEEAGGYSHYMSSTRYLF